MNLADLIIIAFTDPAGGKTKTQQLKRTSARAAIVVIGVDPIGRIYVLHSWADRCSTDMYVTKIYAVNDLFHPKIFGVEANAMQALFGDMLARAARAMQKRIPFTPVPQSTKVDKRWRIRTIIQPVLGAGRLFVLDDQLELKAELSTFPMSPTVDLIDALASAISLAPPRAAKIERDQRNVAFAKYLRDSGMSPKAIQERMEALRTQRR